MVQDFVHQQYLLAILQEILFYFPSKYNNYSHFYSLSKGSSKVTRINAPVLTASNESWRWIPLTIRCVWKLETLPGWILLMGWNIHVKLRVGLEPQLLGQNIQKIMATNHLALETEHTWQKSSLPLKHLTRLFLDYTFSNHPRNLFFCKNFFMANLRMPPSNGWALLGFSNDISQQRQPEPCKRAHPWNPTAQRGETTRNLAAFEGPQGPCYAYQLIPPKINESNLKMMVWFRCIFPFSRGVFSGSMLIFQGVFPPRKPRWQ